MSNRQGGKPKPKAPKTEAVVAAFRVGQEPMHVHADIQCGCGDIFRVAIPVEDGLLEPAVTSKWSPEEGGYECPSCTRGHRVRVTVVVNVEEEVRDVWLKRTGRR